MWEDTKTQSSSKFIDEQMCDFKIKRFSFFVNLPHTNFYRHRMHIIDLINKCSSEEGRHIYIYYIYKLFF